MRRSPRTPSNEDVFVYDILGGAPIKKQVIPVPVTYFGIAWDPASNGTAAHFYVPTCSADAVFVYSYNAAAQQWYLDLSNTPNLGKQGQSPASPAAPLWLGHTAGIGLNVVPPVNAVPVDQQVAVYPLRAGIALSNTGQTIGIPKVAGADLTVGSGGRACGILAGQHIGIVGHKRIRGHAFSQGGKSDIDTAIQSIGIRTESAKSWFRQQFS